MTAVGLRRRLEDELTPSTRQSVPFKCAYRGLVSEWSPATTFLTAAISSTVMAWYFASNSAKTYIHCRPSTSLLLRKPRVPRLEVFLAQKPF